MMVKRKVEQTCGYVRNLTIASGTESLGDSVWSNLSKARHVEPSGGYVYVLPDDEGHRYEWMWIANACICGGYIDNRAIRLQFSAGLKPLGFAQIP